MPNLVSPKRVRTHPKETDRFDSVMKKIRVLENKIRSNYEVGDIKMRTTGKASQLIWKRGLLRYESASS